MTSEPRYNLSNAIFECNWNEVPNYLDEIKEINEFGGTALHTAFFYHNTTPYNIFQLLIDAYPEAAKIQNSLGFTPLHYSRKDFSDECTMLLLNVAPETIGVQNYTTGCTPLHYALRDCRSNSLIQAMLQTCPSALKVTNHLGQTPLDWFFLHWYEPIQKLLTTIDDGRRSLSPDQMLDVVLVNTRRGQITVGYVYHTMYLLFRQSMILDQVETSPSAIPPILYAAFYLNYCPWLFCKFLAHLQLQDIFKTKDNDICCILLQCSSDRASQRSYSYNRIYKCTSCGSTTSKLFKGTRGFSCHDCIKHKLAKLHNVVVLHRDEELERLQFIYFLLRGDPTLCAIDNTQ